MPESPDANLDSIEEQVKKLVEEFGGKWDSCSREPIAFGLVAVQPTFRVDENQGDTEELENKISALESVASCEVIGCTRALG